MLSITKKRGAGRLAVLPLLLLCGMAWSADNSMPLTMEGGTARAMAMGSAAVGLPQGSASLLWNPAGLADMQKMEVGLHHNSGLGDLISEDFVMGVPLGALGGFAVSMNYLTNGTFAGRNSVAALTGDYTPAEFGISAGWGSRLASNLSAGAALKLNYQNLSINSYSALAVDLGLLWNPCYRFCLGVTYSNLGTAVAGSLLDSGWRIGVSYGLNDSVILAVSGELKPSAYNRMQSGIECFITPGVALRAGYVINFQSINFDSLNGLTAGLGLNISKDMTVDYAYLPYGDLGVSHRLSATWKFGEVVKR